MVFRLVFSLFECGRWCCCCDWIVCSSMVFLMPVDIYGSKGWKFITSNLCERRQTLWCFLILFCVSSALTIIAFSVYIWVVWSVYGNTIQFEQWNVLKVHNYCFFQNAKTIACVFVFFFSLSLPLSVLSFSFRVISLYIIFTFWLANFFLFVYFPYYIHIIIQEGEKNGSLIIIRCCAVFVLFFLFICVFSSLLLFLMHLNKYHQKRQCRLIEKA